MPPPTATDQTSLDDAIRVSAYRFWQAAGSPAGHAVDFWLTATRSTAPSYPLGAQEVWPAQFGYEGGVSAQPPLVGHAADFSHF